MHRDLRLYESSFSLELLHLRQHGQMSEIIKSYKSYQRWAGLKFQLTTVAPELHFGGSPVFYLLMSVDSITVLSHDDTSNTLIGGIPSRLLHSIRLPKLLIAHVIIKIHAVFAFSFLAFFQAFIWFSRPMNSGTPTGPNNGRYTAILCSSGK